MDVLLTGPSRRPGIAMLTHSMRCDLGVMISASHNPYDDNGIKLFGPDGLKLSDARRRRRSRTLVDADLCKRLAAPAALGRAKRIDGVQDRYVEFAKRTLARDLSLDGLRVVVDCANGAGYVVAPQALWELGAEVFTVGVEPDGFNINRDVGSTSPAALIDKCARSAPTSASRSTATPIAWWWSTKRASIVDGDQLLAVIAESWTEDGRLARRRHCRHCHVQSRP